MRILVAEDGASLADFLCQELQNEQFAVQVARMASQRKSWLRINTTILSFSTVLSLAPRAWPPTDSDHPRGCSGESVKTPGLASSWLTVQKYSFL
jgi:hypothetical protein